jgi:hypothetical protein
MAKRTFEVASIVSALHGDQLAANIANTWTNWDGLRARWLEQRRELRNYIVATDTTNTTNSALPWKNKTTLPKLTQIRDNLAANYLSAMFPNDEWLSWEGDEEEAVMRTKKDAVEAYMKTKLRNIKFKQLMSLLIEDYIDYGNTYAMVGFERDVIQKENDTEPTVRYIGPTVSRISPLDIVFNPHASDFYSTPKIIRSIFTIGELLKEVEENTDMQYDREAIQQMLDVRAQTSEAAGRGDNIKDESCKIDGFGGWYQYFQSGYVELLTLYGDIYDQQTGTMLRDHIVVVADRKYTILKKENPSWYGRAPIHHVGWRTRSDNLVAMGPLDNLVGMQYRIDHLENLKADAFDMIVFPVLKIKGDVEEFDYGPNARIYVHDEGDVEFMHPDAAALQADNQIELLESRMEAYAGAPKDAMGFRTPGEKTKYEVEQLQVAASRIFQVKIERLGEFVGDIINDCLEVARRNIGSGSDIARLIDDETGVVEFMTITKADLQAKGRLIPTGAKHFAAQAKMVQELSAFAASPLGQNPNVAVHFSGFKIAQLFEELLGISRFKIVQKNVGILEAFDQERMKQSAQEQMQVEQNMPVESEQEAMPINETQAGIPPEGA